MMVTEEWEFHFCLRDRLIILCMCEYMKLLLMSLWATSVKNSFKTLSFSIGFNFVMTFLLRFWGKEAVTIKGTYSTGTFLYWRFYVVFKKFIRQQHTNPPKLFHVICSEPNFFLFQPLFFDREKILFSKEQNLCKHLWTETKSCPGTQIWEYLIA